MQLGEYFFLLLILRENVVPFITHLRAPAWVAPTRITTRVYVFLCVLWPHTHNQQKRVYPLFIKRGVYCIIAHAVRA